MYYLDTAASCGTQSCTFCAYLHVQSTLSRTTAQSQAPQKPSLTDFDLGVFRRLYYSAASIQEYKKGSVPSKYRTLLGY